MVGLWGCCELERGFLNFSLAGVTEFHRQRKIRKQEKIRFNKKFVK